LETGPGEKDARIASPAARQKELPDSLLQAHAALLQRDQEIQNLLQTPDARTYQTLVDFLNQLNDAAGKLYRSSRWRWTNPLQALKGLFRGSKSPPAGYWRIDNVLDAYKAWQLHQPGGRSWELTEGAAQEPKPADWPPPAAKKTGL
jgi:hypothetical protein